MKRIPLSQGKFAIVDDEDYEYLIQWKWYIQKDRNTYYARRNQCIIESEVRKARRAILMHRVIMKVPRNLQIDHMNHDGLDNRKCNMRICTHIENHYNELKRKSKTSKYKGVSRDGNMWRAYINYNGKRTYLGSYVSEINAAEAYDVKAKEFFGEFAHLNLEKVCLI